jgi:hypothetical protein
MPGTTDRVVLDLDVFPGLIGDLVAARDLLWRTARAVTDVLERVRLPADPAGRLRLLGNWADGEAGMLRRRLALAESADGADLAGPKAGTRRTVTLSGPPDAYRTAPAAAAAGAALAFGLADPGTSREDLDGALTALRVHADDPDFVRGFFEVLGPAGLAGLLYLVEGLPAGPGDRRHQHAGTGRGRTDQARTGRRDIPVPTAAAEVTLGRALACYSRVCPLDERWLGRFNTRGRDDAAETGLLGPLLPHGRFAAGLLRLLGDGLFAGNRLGPPGHPAGLGRTPGRPGGHPAVHDVGLFAPGAAAGGLPPARYAVALLHAIADDPRLAVSFGVSHVEQIVHRSRVGTLGPPFDPGEPVQVERARAELIARAGGGAARRADPTAAATFVARLALAVHQGPPVHVSPALAAAFGQLLHAYRDDLYGSVMSLVPETAALRDPSGRGVVPTWPATGGPWSAANRADPAAAIPAELWAALLRESLCGGTSAATLAVDAVTVADRLERAVAAATRGYARGGARAYPASPRALGHFQQAQVQSFFTGALIEAVDALGRDRAAAEQTRRQQIGLVITVLGEVAKSIDFTSVTRTVTNVSVNVTVEVLAARARAALAGTAASETRTPPGVAELRAAVTRVPGWQAAYRASVADLWARRGSDPIQPVDVTDAAGRTRRFTGDPYRDGFITSAASDFFDATGMPLDPRRMTAAQRAAYVGWLASPAVVANNDRVPVAGIQRLPG